LDFYLTHLYGQNISQRFKIENRIQNLQKAKLLILDHHLGTHNLIKTSNHRIVSSFRILTKFLTINYYLLFTHAKLFNIVVNEPCQLQKKFLKISNTMQSMYVDPNSCLKIGTLLKCGHFLTSGRRLFDVKSSRRVSRLRSRTL
jgi:hypothetical protein